MTAKAFNGKESQANVRCSRLSPYPPKGKSASSPLSRERHGQKHGHCAVREPFSLKGDSVSCWRSLVTGTHGLNPHLLVCKCANSPCLNRGVQSTSLCQVCQFAVSQSRGSVHLPVPSVPIRRVS